MSKLKFLASLKESNIKVSVPPLFNEPNKYATFNLFITRNYKTSFLNKFFLTGLTPVRSTGPTGQAGIT